jgi:hypothetical protein
LPIGTFCDPMSSELAVWFGAIVACPGEERQFSLAVDLVCDEREIVMRSQGSAKLKEAWSCDGGACSDEGLFKGLPDRLTCPLVAMELLPRSVIP